MPAAEKAFCELKKRFTSAPILCRPDPSRQFIVEVDASDGGVGAVLSQRSETDQKLHPCAFFSHKLSPTERNYDIGDRELLPVKLALAEWRHWLEGAKEPFLVWTDHKNLEYIHSAKRLNPRQARWSLFFSRFNFCLSFCGASRSLIILLNLILPCLLSASLKLHLGILSESFSQLSLVSATQAPAPLTVFLFLSPQVLQWGHSSKLACHPGVRRTAALIRQLFWWPAMDKELKDFVKACSFCARNKASNQPPAGLLQPLPVPRRDHGPTSPLTSLRDCHLHMITPLFSP